MMADNNDTALTSSSYKGQPSKKSNCLSFKCGLLIVLVLFTIFCTYLYETSFCHFYLSSTLASLSREILSGRINSSKSNLSYYSKSPPLSVPPRVYNKKTFDEMARIFQQSRVSCSALYAGVPQSVTHAVNIAKILAAEEEKRHGSKDQTGDDGVDKKLQKEVQNWAGEFESLTNGWYLNATRDCNQFRQSRGYITSSLTKEEEDFPIAFSILLYKDIEMAERLFRSVYRPQNRYCIHVDSKSDPQFFAAVQSLVQCFSENVVLSSRRVNVTWGKYTVLEPEITCMGDLWAMDSRATNSLTASLKTETKQGKITINKQQRKKWKYFINLTGQEFPLKTNYELVQILKAFKGANCQEGSRKRKDEYRWLTQPPFGVIPTKGSVHTVLKRATIDYILHNRSGQMIHEWVKHQIVSDEGFFATLNYNPQLNIPGTYNGSNLKGVPMIARHKRWLDDKCPRQPLVRDICILSTGDLKVLGQSMQLFANKFFLHEDRIVIGCLEEKLFNDTRDEFLGRKTFDTTFYAEQDFVINRVRG